MFGDTSFIQSLLPERKRTPGALRALAGIAIACLSLALQPCARAAVQDGGCPGCPHGTEHRASSHHSASEAPEDAGAACAAHTFDCPRSDVYSRDARSGKLPLKSAQADRSGGGSDGGYGYGAFAVLDTTLMRPAVLRAPMPYAVRREFLDPRAAPSRNVLFCVYLK